ncbi:MAG: hypothetical protein WDN00_09910 [Limisphaerales bacterium]
MMINVDENFPVSDTISGLAEPLEAGAIRGDDAVEGLPVLGFMEQTIRIEKF